MAIAIFLLKGEIGEEWEESGISWQVRACKNYNQFSFKHKHKRSTNNKRQYIFIILLQNNL